MREILGLTMLEEAWVRGGLGLVCGSLVGRGWRSGGLTGSWGGSPRDRNLSDVRFFSRRM